MARLLFPYLILIIFGIYPDALGEKPTLIPSDSEMMIEEGNELRIQCYSNLQISLRFSYPEYTFMSPRSAHEIWLTENGTLTFLRRSAISLDTGWYACAAEDVEVKNDFKTLNHKHEDIAWIYVYVSSLEPFADHHYTFAKTIISLAGHPGIVPCRLTSPNLNVKLWRNFRIVHPNEQLQFDPKIGFIVEPPSSEDFEFIFQCEVSGIKDNYILRYSNATGRKPRINTTSDELFLKTGDELRIECYGETNIEFAFPKIIIGDPYTVGPESSTHEFASNKKGKKTFIRHTVVPEDTGWYGCAEEGINSQAISFFYMDYTKREINWIYVYVESSTPNNYAKIGIYQTRPIHTTQLMNTEVQVDHNVRNSSVSMPCLPTSPKFDVLLKCESRIVTLDENVQFNPKFGFIFKRSSRHTAKECCTCVMHDHDLSTPTYCFKPDTTFRPSPVIYNNYRLLLISEDLHLTCNIDTLPPKLLVLEWNTPTTTLEKRVERILRPSFGHFHSFGRCFQQYQITLTIKNVTKDESGQYTCTLRSAEHETETSANVAIYDRRNVHYIDPAVSLRYSVVEQKGRSVALIIGSEVYFPRSILWFTPSGIRIDYLSKITRNKYKLHRSTDGREMLRIFNLTLEDSGSYNVTGFWIPVGEHIEITLDVQAPPTVTIEGESKRGYIAPGQSFQVHSRITGSPTPNITWSFAGDPNFLSDKDSFSMISLDPQNGFIDKYTQLSNVELKTNISGSLTCTACNLLKCCRDSKLVIVTDTIGGFDIIGPEKTAYLGDDVTLTCVAPIYEFKNLTWDEKFNECHESTNRNMFYIEEKRTKYTVRRILQIRNVTECHRRSYSCWGQTTEGNIRNSSYHLQLNYPVKPYFTRNNLNESQIMSLSKSDNYTTKSLYCCADGNPTPNISWFQDNVRLNENSVYKFSLLGCQLDVVLNYLPEQNGKLTCKAENRYGKIEDYVYFVAEDGDGQNGNLLAGIISLALVLVVLLLTWSFIKKYRKRIARRKFKEAVLQHFNEGALNRLDPNLDVIDQAEVLPYNKEWEYPRKMLKLGKVLGSGAFGIVRKAEAKAMRPGEPFTTVAVKMVQATSPLHHMVALCRELKILVHLGQHLNIVNLLGACTKNISYGQLLVIVEFCRFGNLQDYLSHRRDDFIDQIDPTTGDINALDQCTGHINVNDNEIPSSTNGNAEADEGVSSDASAALGLRSKYEGDYMDIDMGPIRTKDLLSWAWQISRGMRYLGTRKVIHGDLAARNILLADNNVIKICDFGLAKALYKEDHYMKREGDPLPLKWMAIEAIRDLRFSIESDVWSFGIALWELFTLAESPYPGIHPRHVYQKLCEGYRMDKPKYAPQTIYRLMMKCWEAEPANRPSFSTIEIGIHELLDDSAKTYYMDLSNQYNDMNTGIFATGKKDYLTMNPLEIEAVPFSVEQKAVELNNVPSNEPSSSRVQQ